MCWIDNWQNAESSLCENYVHTTGQSDWYLLNFDLSWLIFSCHIIEYRAKFDKSNLSLWQTNPKFLPVADKFCLTLTCDRRGFAQTSIWKYTNCDWMVFEGGLKNILSKQWEYKHRNDYAANRDNKVWKYQEKIQLPVM